jgi:hypothetical protein
VRLQNLTADALSANLTGYVQNETWYLNRTIDTESIVYHIAQVNDTGFTVNFRHSEKYMYNGNVNVSCSWWDRC